MRTQALKITADHWEQMRAQVEAEAPNEACGLLAGLEGRVDQVFALENELHSPTRFRSNPRQQLAAFEAIETAGQDLLAIYHSHPSGPPHPSATDVVEALYPGVAHLIWHRAGGEWQAQAFSIEGNRYATIPLLIETEPATSSP